VKYEETEKENERLKTLLEFRKSISTPTIGARVIGWDVSPWRKTILIDKGSRDGIFKRMPVISPDGFVGRVIEVSPNVARVLLILDADSRVSALTSDSRMPGVITGDGSPILQMKYLDLQAELALSESVLTSGVGGLFPKGIKIGQIEAINRDRDGLHLVAIVRSEVDFFKLEEVLCLVYSQQE